MSDAHTSTEVVALYREYLQVLGGNADGTIRIPESLEKWADVASNFYGCSTDKLISRGYAAGIKERMMEVILSNGFDNPERVRDFQ